MINYSVTLILYNIYFNFMVPYVSDPANQLRLGLSDAQIKQMNNMLVDWNNAYNGYIFPGTYGKLTTAQVNELFLTCKKYSDGMKQQLKGNPSIKLLTADYMFIAIHENVKPRTSIPKPTHEAGVTLKLASHLNNEYHAFDIANPTKGGKPVDVKRIKIKLLVLKADVPFPTLDMLEDWDNVGSMNFDIPFSLSQIGMIAYVAVCFSNDAGDSDYSAIIASPII